MDTKAFIATAAAEESDLVAELGRIDTDYQQKRTPVVRKLEALRQVMAAYGSDAPPTASRVINLDALQTPLGPLGSISSSHKARVTDNAAVLLGSGAPMKTPLLLEQLEARGVEFQAKDKLGNLSAILSRDSRFVSDRRTGWSLAQKNPQDVAASAGSSPT